jgi:uncharacterized membrane protein YccF (DUF307 family)
VRHIAACGRRCDERSVSSLASDWVLAIAAHRPSFLIVNEFGNTSVHGYGASLTVTARSRLTSDSACDDDAVRVLGNVIWFVLAGFWLWLVYVLAGILACILIITIPFGIAAFRIAGFVVWPFGRTTITKPTAGVGSFIGNIVWLILLGWELALAHLATALLLAVTIIGIPLAVANVKLIPVSLWPLGREVVAIEVARKRGIAVTTPQSLGGA